MPLSRSREGLVRPLEDALRPDVDPAARGHLAEHGQPRCLEPAELVPGGPARDEERVRDQHTRRTGVRSEDADRLAALDEQRLVAPEREQRPDDRAQGLVVSRRLAGTAVDDELLRALRDLGVEIVEEHSERRLGRPGPRVQLRAARRPDAREIATERLDGLLERVDRRHGFVRSSSIRRWNRHHA